MSFFSRSYYPFVVSIYPRGKRLSKSCYRVELDNKWCNDKIAAAFVVASFIIQLHAITNDATTRSLPLLSQSEHNVIIISLRIILSLCTKHKNMNGVSTSSLNRNLWFFHAIKFHQNPTRISRYKLKRHDKHTHTIAHTHTHIHIHTHTHTHTHT